MCEVWCGGGGGGGSAELGRGPWEPGSSYVPPCGSLYPPGAMLLAVVDADTKERQRMHLYAGAKGLPLQHPFQSSNE